MYRPFVTLLEGIDVIREKFEPVDQSGKEASVLTLKGNNVTLGYIRNPSADWRLLRDLRDPEILSEICIPAEHIQKAELVPIWQEHIVMEAENAQLVLKNIRYGTFFRI